MKKFFRPSAQKIVVALLIAGVVWLSSQISGTFVTTTFSFFVDLPSPDSADLGSLGQSLRSFFEPTLEGLSSRPAIVFLAIAFGLEALAKVGLCYTAACAIVLLPQSFGGGRRADAREDIGLQPDSANSTVPADAAKGPPRG